jgi:23S rRNA (uracil1939-C5)-methyltransferase
VPPEGGPQTATRPERGQELELRVDSLAFGGAGVARSGGYVVFVAGAVPGDRVRAVIRKRKRAYAEASTVEVLDPSPERIPARAEHPGAPWQVLPYERQLEVKQDQVKDALTRLGRLGSSELGSFDLKPIIPAHETWRYRNKVEYSFGTGADGELICGFHAPGQWHEIVGIHDCLLVSEASNRIRERVVQWARDHGLSAHDRRTGEGVLRHLVVREGRRTGQLQARLVTSTSARLDLDALARALTPIHSLLWTRLDSVAEVTHGGETELITGVEYLEEEIEGLRLRISPEAFFQTNTEMAERLYATAIELANPQALDRAYDLYCGIGTIALLLAPRVAQVWGLEIVERAVADAIRGARLNEITTAHFFAGDVRLAMRDLVERAGRPDLLMVDPPRAGLSQKVVRRILEAAPRRIVYVSCNPTTLAPNAAQLAGGGYRLRSVTPVDMFPQTPHIECVALLERG